MAGPTPDVAAAAELLRERGGEGDPELFLVLGSGLSPLAESIDDPVEVPFTDLPGFPGPTVTGHAGRFLLGTLEGRRVLVQSGRYHFYEGHPARTVTAPVRVAAELGAGVCILTNAAGGIARGLEPGSLMLLDDHIHLQFRSPLAGPVVGEEPRFPDMSRPYDPELQELALRVALETGVRLERGVYLSVLGPSYETPAEVRMLERLGADAVGMSTTAEATVARARGLRVMAVSLITNFAAGRSLEPLDHAEVVEVGRDAAGRLITVLRGVLRALPGAGSASGGQSEVD